MIWKKHKHKWPDPLTATLLFDHARQTGMVLTLHCQEKGCTAIKTIIPSTGQVIVG